MNSVMALDVVCIDRPDIDTFEENSNITSIWKSRPFYYPKKKWIENKILSVYKDASVSEISNVGLLLKRGSNTYRFDFNDSGIFAHLNHRKSYGIVVPLSDFPFVLYMDHGTFKIDTYDSVKIEKVYRHELVYNELKTLAVCNHTVIPAMYEALSGNKSLLDACITGNGTNTLDLVLMILTLAGAEFPEHETLCVSESIFKYGFKHYDEK